MKKDIWVYGLIGGTIAAVWGVLGEGVIGDKLSLLTRTICGYATMILAFSLIFVAVKNYRDNYNGGTVTFGKALSIGLLITAIASTLYVIIWMIDFRYFLSDFGEKYTAQAMAEMKASGATATEIKEQGTKMAATMAAYKSSPVFRIIFTYIEILPVGIIMSLIAALILKHRTKPTTISV